MRFPRVRKKPSVGIVPTGSELVPVGSTLRPGDIVEFNSLMLSDLIISFLLDAGCIKFGSLTNFSIFDW